MLHLYAALAEKERRLIAERTRAALAARKAQGANRPDLNRLGCVIVADSALAVIGPIPGMVSSFLLTSFDRCHALMRRVQLTYAAMRILQLRNQQQQHISGHRHQKLMLIASTVAIRSGAL